MTTMFRNCQLAQVTSGQSAIFNQVGNRQLVTLDLNTTLSQTITFVVRMNNPTRDEQHCPGPDRPVESVYVHSSCNGGITWSLVTFIQPLTTGRVPIYSCIFRLSLISRSKWECLNCIDLHISDIIIINIIVSKFT